jgi:hypothetical protein
MSLFFPARSLKNGKIYISATTKLFIGLLVLTIPLGWACGKRRPPLPPVAKVVQRAEISGFQRGNRVVLSWRMPERNASRDNILHIAKIEVYRLAERSTEPPNITEEEFASRGILIASIPVKDSDFGNKPLSYSDTLQFAGQPLRLRYAVRFVNASGQKAAFSNLIVIQPEAKVAAGPTALAARVTQDSIELKWTAPDKNADGTTPVNLLGYNVYRSESRDKAAKLINAKTLSDTDFADTTFEFEKEYFYFVRSVSTGTGDQPTESTESNIVEVKPVDKFPPSAPASITIAASPDTISIFFPPNPEKDVVGYKIYRSEDGSLPKVEWKLLNPKPQDANTFQDTTVEKGKTFFYYVTAVDSFNNESQPSEVVSDKLP